MTDGVITCRFEIDGSGAVCEDAATHIVCEPLSDYAFVVCDKHYPGLEAMLREKGGSLVWTVQRINADVYRKITGKPPLSNRGVTKIRSAKNA